MTLVRAFNKTQAARLAQVSERQVSYWASTGVLEPSILYDRERRPMRYLYSFEDVVRLRALGVVRNVHGLSLQQLRIAGSYLREYANRPWSELAFWVRGNDLYFSSPDNDPPVSPNGRGQSTAIVELERVAAQVQHDVERSMKRDPSDIGKTERRREVQDNQLVLKGTRVPVSSVLSLAEDGYSVEAIVAAYPSLTRGDVLAVLETGKIASVA
jgi:DNA-binding transcriptional MerR regulator